MNLTRIVVSFALLCSACLTGPAIQNLQAQNPKTPGPREADRVAPVASRVWKSQTSGKEYRVWVENQQFHAEWVNIPREFAAKGAHICTICRRMDTKWIGESRSYLPCSVGQGSKEHLANWCHVVTGFEVISMTGNRITGRGEGLKKFDCRKCQVIEKVWRNFAWVPQP